MEAVLDPPAIGQNTPASQSESQYHPNTRNRRKRGNIAMAGALVAGGATFPEAAEKSGYKNGDSVRACLFVKGVTKAKVTKSQNDKIVSDVLVNQLVLTVASQAGEVLRNKYAAELDRRADSLLKVPSKPNLKHLKAAGEVLESQVRAAKIVHGWSDAITVGLVSPGQVTDIESSIVVQPSENTPTGSVVSSEIPDAIPQDASI